MHPRHELCHATATKLRNGLIDEPFPAKTLARILDDLAWLEEDGSDPDTSQLIDIILDHLNLSYVGLRAGIYIKPKAPTISSNEG